LGLISGGFKSLFGADFKRIEADLGADFKRIEADWGADFKRIEADWGADRASREREREREREGLPWHSLVGGVVRLQAEGRAEAAV
jgi:hypothetical protein